MEEQENSSGASGQAYVLDEEAVVIPRRRGRHRPPVAGSPAHSDRSSSVFGLTDIEERLLDFSSSDSDLGVENRNVAVAEEMARPNQAAGLSSGQYGNEGGAGGFSRREESSSNLDADVEDETESEHGQVFQPNQDTNASRNLRTARNSAIWINSDRSSSVFELTDIEERLLDFSSSDSDLGVENRNVAVAEEMARPNQSAGLSSGQYGNEGGAGGFSRREESSSNLDADVEDETESEHEYERVFTPNQAANASRNVTSGMNIIERAIRGVVPYVSPVGMGAVTVAGQSLDSVHANSIATDVINRSFSVGEGQRLYKSASSESAVTCVKEPLTHDPIKENFESIQSQAGHIRRAIGDIDSVDLAVNSQNVSRDTGKVITIEDIDRLFLCAESLNTPGRQLKRSEMFFFRSNQNVKERRVYLFNDLLMYSTVVLRGVYERDQRSFHIKDVMVDREESPCGEPFSFSVRTPTKTFILLAPDFSTMEIWMNEIYFTSEMYRESHHIERAPYYMPVIELFKGKYRCRDCNMTFTFLRRKCTCHYCGHVLCSSCASTLVHFPASLIFRQRICSACKDMTPNMRL